jgi:hypothetical protein
MCELPAGGNWNFDVRWSPKVGCSLCMLFSLSGIHQLLLISHLNVAFLILQLPAILSTSSFDGTVSVYSLTDTGDGVSAGQVHAFALSFPEVRMSMVSALLGVDFE